jgi:hypothetical protein
MLGKSKQIGLFFVAWSDCDNRFILFLDQRADVRGNILQLFMTPNERNKAHCICSSSVHSGSIQFDPPVDVASVAASAPPMQRVVGMGWRWSASPFRVRFWRAVVRSLNAQHFTFRPHCIIVPPPCRTAWKLSELESRASMDWLLCPCHGIKPLVAG